jgi:hypothetical protein
MRVLARRSLPPFRGPARGLALGLTLGALVLAGCGGGDDPAADSTAVDAAGDTSIGAAVADGVPSDAPAGAPADAPITAADLDVYQRALTAEIALVNDAIARKARATTAEDSMTAMLDALDMKTEPEAARQAGIPVERYRQLGSVLGGALARRQMNPGMQSMMAGMDTSGIGTQPADVQERMRQNMREAAAAFSDSATYREVPPALREEFKRRAEGGLDSLWRELFARRAAAAGLGR